MKKIIVMLIMVLGIGGCMHQGKASSPIPMQLMDETVSLVGLSPKTDEWHTYCGGVWVDGETILTAYHCAAAAKRMSMSFEDRVIAELTEAPVDAMGAPVNFADKSAFDVIQKGATKHYSGVVIAADSEHDIALIKANGYPAHLAATVAKVLPNIGEEVSVVGHPAGLSFTYTHGYVSAYHSDIDPDAWDIRGPFLQVNANIVGGNSGGGVFNTDGELIGIISFVNERAIGQGFAVPATTIKKLLEEYNKKKKDK